MTKGHAERLMPMLEEVLAEAGHGYGDLAGLAVAVGPGNFTGLRIGVSAARGLAMALGIPAIGVSVLEALAFETRGPVLALADARGGRVYAQRFEDGKPLGAAEMVMAEDLTAFQSATVVGFDAEATAARLGLSASSGPERPGAEAIGRLALAGDWRSAAAPAPLYIRPPHATPPKALAG